MSLACTKNPKKIWNFCSVQSNSWSIYAYFLLIHVLSRWRSGHSWNRLDFFPGFPDLYQGRVVARWQLTGRTDWRNDNSRLSAHSLPGYKLVASHYLITQLFRRWPNYLHVTSLVTQLSRAQGPALLSPLVTRCGLMRVISLARPGSLIS